MAKIRTLIIDDSAVVRETLLAILSDVSDIEVVGTARDPIVAMDRMSGSRPDVIILDIEMPRMDGLEFLRKTMATNPVPVVVCSGLTDGQSDVALQAIELGAAEIVTKPKIGVKQFLEESLVQISDAVRAAYAAGVERPRFSSRSIPPRNSADAVLPRAKGSRPASTTDKVIVVGASTGGTEALRVFLEAMPVDAPGIAIVQHMPEHFTEAFARRLDGICAIEIKEAEDHDRVLPGRAIIARGNHHLVLKRGGSGYYVEVVHGPLVNRHRPSVDVLFRSAARYAGTNAVGVIMTGMGDDGAAGMDEMHQQGAFTLAQDEASCVVFGMPKEAIDRGGVSRVLPIESLAPAALNAAKSERGGL